MKRARANAEETKEIKKKIMFTFKKKNVHLSFHSEAILIFILECDSHFF